ncbi:GNAT family N-acetyltransferase [Paludisphaera mucosa]|uniref:GNAT family N-acetyltransferase n=1 Tax=Paludisphaera mucosa TaxID=3030827 RepID=A0ABT6F3V8_9BACT|nr:GNAT family N-acetyltransferase [Paludisphaera mucosa]MDG3002204.1 GNAT family N-acetyltransferase [Paludisphaera mucosa]
MLDDSELARRSILGFGEMIAALGRWGVGPEAEVRRRDALGARIDAAADNPWFDAAVVPIDESPPADDPRLPRCLWTVADSAPGRVEAAGIATPCLGLALDDPALKLDGGASDVGTPSLAALGDVNERAYGQFGVFGPLVSAIRDDRVRTHGLRDGDAFVCVALTMAIGDDLSIQYVATEAGHRRRGLAGRLLLATLASARGDGLRSATLQASPDGLSVYERLGFRSVATLRAFVRPDVGE